MQRLLTFTSMRFGVHPALAGIIAFLLPWVILAAVGIAALFAITT